MPELPEVANLARQMNRELRGRRVAEVDVVQPRCLNVPPEKFEGMLFHTQVNRVTSRGKWIFIDLEPGAMLLLNLGMGGEVLFHHKGEPCRGTASRPSCSKTAVLSASTSGGSGMFTRSGSPNCPPMP